MPTAHEAPRFEVYFAEEPHPSATPIGSKGIGEAATIASTPVVISAVEDAIRKINPKARIAKTPADPEYVYKLMWSAQG